VTRGRKTSPPSKCDETNLGAFGSFAGLAAAFALAGILALATGITGLATAFAFTGVLAFAVVLVLARIGVIGQLAFGHTTLTGTTAARSRCVQARSRTGQQPGEGDGRQHGFRGLEETWIFHLILTFLVSQRVFVDLLSPGNQPDKIRRYPVRRRSLGFIPENVPANYGEPFWFVMVFLLGSSDQMGAWTPAPP